jgi:hypothetical protein
MDRVLVDAQWQQCQFNKEGGNDQENRVIVVVNPTPTSDNDRLFYGIVRTRQLQEAAKTCAKTGKVGGTSLTVLGIASGNPGATRIGSAIFTFSGLSCASVANEIAKGNLVGALMPGLVVQHVVGGMLTKQAVSMIPLLSGADKDNIYKIVDKVTAVPSVTVGGKNVDIQAAGVKASFPKPKVTIRW